jgi:hypothetical protein
MQVKHKRFLNNDILESEDTRPLFEIEATYVVAIMSHTCNHLPNSIYAMSINN